MVAVERKKRSFAVPFAMGAVILFSLQAIIYILILDDTVGGVSFIQRAPAEVPDLQVVVLRSEATAGQWENSEGYDTRIRTWDELLAREQIPHRVVGEAGLAGALEGASVAVLPGATCLGSRVREQLDAFLAAGRGVVATGALGTRDGECTWLGWDYLSAFTGATAATAASPEGTTFATFRGDQFYADRVPAGYRLGVPRQELSVVEIESPDAFWSDWRLRPARGTRPSGAALATHRIHDSGARSVWLGFEATSFGRERQDQDVLEGYLLSAVTWTARQPIAHLASWPSAAPSAALVSVVVDGDLSVEGLAPLLREHAVPVTFAVAPGQSASTLATLADAGEIAARGGEPDTLAGQQLERQRRRLTDARTRLQAATHAQVEGLLPPEGVTDHLTPRAMDEAGLTYTLGEVSDIRGTPELVLRPRLLFPRPVPGVVRMFQAAHDDLEVMANAQGITAADAPLAEGFLWDFERLHYLGGVYPLTFHAGLMAPDQQQQVLSRLLREFEQRGVWATSGSELTFWWGARSQLRVTVSRVSPYRLQLDVSNHGQTDLREVSAYVHLPHRPLTLDLRSPVFRLTPPRHSLLPGEPILRLDFDELARQTNYSYMVVLDE